MSTVTTEETSTVEQSVIPQTNLSSNSLGRMALRRFFRQRSALVGLAMLGVLVFMAVFADVIAPYSPTEVLIDKEDVERRDPPCIHLLGCPEDKPQHLMGIDGNSRDLLSRVIHGSRWSLIIGFTTVTGAIVVGTMLGALAGYLGGWVDLIIMRIMDVMLAFPSLLLAIAIVSVMGFGLINSLIAIGIVSIPAYARLMRASVLSIKEAEYVEASQALGASSWHIMMRRILPNSLTPLVIQGTLGIATAILEAAALSFLGFGAQKPTPEWGVMVGEERNQLLTAPHLLFFPGMMITLTVLSFNLIGDGLRDALDPRLAQSEGGGKAGG